MVHWGFLILAFLVGMAAGSCLLIQILKIGAEVANAIESTSRYSTPLR